jgi:hypothetical protein
MKKIFLIILFTAEVATFSHQKAHAQGVDLGIYPPAIEVNTIPPSSVKAPLTIENNGDTDITADIQYKLFRPAKEENGTITYLTGKDAEPSPDPLLFQKVQILENDHVITTVRLAPGQQKQLEVHIGIDKESVPADYYFSVIFLAKQSNQYTDSSDTSLDNQNASITTGGVATNVLLSIGPKGKPTAQIKEFSTPSFVSSGPIPFTLRVENTSKHSLAPSGAIFIKNVFGQYVGKVDILPVRVLSNSIRAVPDAKSIDDTTAAALYEQAHPGQKPVMLWPETFLLGPYTAGVYVKLSDDGPILTKTIYFFAFPWQGVIVLIMLLLLGIIVREKVKRRLR